MTSQVPANSTLYYLYIGSQWSGPFQVEQIRFFRRHGQVESDTYAYDPDQQRHYTVGELLAAIDSSSDELRAADGAGGSAALEDPTQREEVKRSTTKVFLASDEPDATATLGTSLDALPDPLRTFFRTYRELTEGSPADREQSLAHLHEMASALGIQLSAAATDCESLTLLVGDLLRMADYLANRHQDDDLWEAVEALRAPRPEADPEECVLAARQLVHLLVERARAGRIQRTDRHTPGLVPTVQPKQQTVRSTARDVRPDPGTASLSESQELRAISDVSETWDQPHARTARMILRDARKELRSTEADLEAVNQAYAQLQEQHTRDLAEAQEMLAALEYARDDEAANAAQALAEVRSLAAEIHRLSEEHLNREPDLQTDIRALADELKGQDATAMAPLAEGLLIRLVARLRNLAKEEAPAGIEGATPADLAALREELAKARSDLVQARAQVLVLTDERDRLKRQLDEQRSAAERAIASAKEREQRLRSTVTALEVTKDLHQDVMRELEVQLQTAQRRVGEMEGELSTVRGELVNTRTNLAERSRELQEEMRRAVELQAMLEARRAELSANLKVAEAQLHQAQADQAAPGATADPELMEALAVKVNHLRTMFEATKRRLDEQQVLAARLEEDLVSSRREALELRSRSDSLTSELDEARAGMASAKKRFEELHRANARLEAERHSLQQELQQTRKGTDTVRREAGAQDKPTESALQSSTNRMNRAMELIETRLQDSTRRLEQANAQLESERRRVQELVDAQSQLQVRVEDLTSDRDHLRAELDRLHADHFADHSRHAASLASATQSTIDAERRLKDATARVVELEGQVGFLQQNQTVAGGALQQLDADGEENASTAFVPPEHVAELTRQLDEARAALAQLKAAGTGEAAAQRQAVAARLTKAEDELAGVIAARDEAGSELKAAVAERDRLGRDLARLKNEHESAAVEQRVALKSARDKLAESQARVALLEKELEQHRDGQARSREVVAERDRLNDEVRSLTARVERARIADELPEVRRQLEREQERIRTLTRSLSDAQQQADEARTRLVEMEARSGSANHERGQLHVEIERLKGELLAAQAAAGAARDGDAGARQHLEARLQDVLTDREQLLSDLTRVNGELMQVRGRLVKAEGEAIAAERLPRERALIADLERQLAALRQEAQAHAAQLGELRAKLGQVTGERDQLQEEVTRLRQHLAMSAGGAALVNELTNLRDRLTRSKMRVRELRVEREQLAEQLKGALAAQAQTQAALTAQAAQLAQAQAQLQGLVPAMAAIAAQPASPATAPTLPIASHTTLVATGHGGATGRAVDPLAVTVAQGQARGAGHPAPITVAPTVQLSTPQPAPAAHSQFAAQEDAGFVSAAAHPAISAESALERNAEGRPSAGGFTSRTSRPRPAPATRSFRQRTARHEAPLAERRDTASSGPWMMPVVVGVVGSVVLAGVAGAWLYGTPLRTVNAWVNADLVVLRAPIEGRVMKNAAAPRGLTTLGTPLVSLANPEPDHRERDKLVTQLQDAEMRLAAYASERAGVVQVPPTSPIAALAAVPAAGDGVAAEQQIAALERQIGDQQVVVADLKVRIAEAEARLAALRAAEIAAPISGQIMRSLATEGRWVRANDPLVEIADRATVMLDATFGGEAQGRIAVGDKVKVHLGDDGPVVEGTVTEVAVDDLSAPLAGPDAANAAAPVAGAPIAAPAAASTPAVAKPAAVVAGGKPTVAEAPARVVTLGALRAGGVRVRISLPDDPAHPISIGQPARVLLSGQDQPWSVRMGIALRERFWL